MKFDVKAFTKLKDIAGFDPWYKDTIALARAQELDEVMDPNYVPNYGNPDALRLWSQKQRAMYAVSRATIRPPELRQYVEAQCNTSDAQKVFIQIIEHVKNSTHATITNKDLHRNIVTSKLSLKTWVKPVYDWVLGFLQSIELYNNQQRNPRMLINEDMARIHLENALSGIKAFQDVTERETDRVVQGGTPFSFEEYVTSVKSVATRVDITRASRSSREANVHTYGEHADADLEEWSARNDLYEINEAKRQNPRGASSYGAQMNKETWDSLTKPTQEVWDTLPPEEKLKILSYGEQRAAKRAASANLHVTEDARQISANVHDTQEEKDEEESHSKSEDNPSIKVNNVLTELRNDTHPGDPRRIMGSSKPSTKNTLEAMMHRLHTSYAPSDDESTSSGESADFHQGGL